jgi:amino acid transporter/nucleotide-binding universal stress UspA family protein
VSGRRLERGLGLYSVSSLSIGAMIGSGIFVLPGLAAELSGPSVILAYVLAGIVVLPAALAQSEMSTAMPRAGGTYLYIDLAMGPLMGTVAGIGVWFSLVFKAAFALDGIGEYLALFADVSAEIVAVAIGIVLIVVNLVGVRQSGRIQAILVTGVLLVLLIFIGGGAVEVDSSRYHPFFTGGFTGLIKTTGVVFVSYAGVTKVASVAEEVARPARTLPVAIMSSLLVMIFVYPAVVYVMIGVTPTDEFLGDTTPMATSIGQFLPDAAVTLVSITAILALTSMANAGLLASSRYPFAMARRRLVPAFFASIGDRSSAPTAAMIATGGVMLALVLTLPIFELAKLASAFQLLVLALANLALITFRRTGLWWYKPAFRAPGYPWLQIGGILASLFLITELGLDAQLGALGIILGSVAWYQVYGRSRSIKESALREGVRQRSMSRLVEMTGRRISNGSTRVAVVSEGDVPGDDRTLLRLAASLVDEAGSVELLRPRGPEELASHLDRSGADLVITVLPEEDAHQPHEIPEGYDTVALAGQEIGAVDRIAVLGSGGPFDVLKISMALRFAQNEGAAVRFVHVLDAASSRAQVRAIEDYHAELARLSTVPTESEVDTSDDLIATLAAAAADADLVIVGAPPERRFLSDLVDRIIARVDAPVLIVGSTRPPDDGPLTRIIRQIEHVLSGGSRRDRAGHPGGEAR